MSERLQQTGISDERLTGGARSRELRARDSDLVICDADEQNEYRQWINVQMFFENHVLKRMVVTLLRAIDALKVRLPDRYLAAVVRDLRLIESNAAEPRAPAPTAVEGPWLVAPAQPTETIVESPVPERVEDACAAEPARDGAPATPLAPDRNIARNVRAYGPEPEPVPQAELIAEYADLLRK